MNETKQSRQSSSFSQSFVLANPKVNLEVPWIESHSQCDFRVKYKSTEICMTNHNLPEAKYLAKFDFTIWNL